MPRTYVYPDGNGKKWHIAFMSNDKTRRALTVCSRWVAPIAVTTKKPADGDICASCQRNAGREPE